MNWIPNPNEEILKLILRSRWDSGALNNRQPILDADIFSWQDFSQFLEQERLFSLVFYLLRDVDWAPGSFREVLEKAYLSTTAQNLILFKELEDYLKLTNSEQINVILLKGAALATQIYPHMAMRPMEDLDILVQPRDASQAISILHNLGYVETRQEEHSGFMLNYENEIGLIKHDKILKMIEVHWSLFNSTYYQNKIPLDLLWNTAESIKFHNTPALILDPEIQFLHLCGHLSMHHAGKGWLWVHDLAEIIMHDSNHLDWERLIKIAQKFELVFPLKIHLTTLAEIYGPIIPAGVISELAEVNPTPFERDYFSRTGASSSTPSRTFIDDFKNIPGLRDKSFFALANIFPSYHYMKHRYKIKHPVMLPFYYIYRWYLGIFGFISNK